MADEGDIGEFERVFHNAVREVIISFLLLLSLIVTSYAIICHYKRRKDTDDGYAGEDDAIVYRISLWICTFTLAVSLGTALLLPFSIISNEVLLLYPDSYYVKWLKGSLIHALWNQIFLFSSVSLFILMPFAYFFTESEGLPGSKKGLMSRVYETTLMLILLSVVVCGLAWVASAIIDDDRYSKQVLFDVWNFYLLYLYSLISLIGVLVLLLCTPVGFTCLFTVVGQWVVKPRFLRDIEEELYRIRLEEKDLLRKIEHRYTPSKIANGHTPPEDIHDRLAQVKAVKQKLELRAQASSLRRNLGYPLAMVAILALTGISLLMVVHNTFQLLIGIKALPVGAKEAVLGITSFSLLGPIGAAVEIAIICYVMLASLVGFYSLPFFRLLQPTVQGTSMVKVIGNCIVILVLSSALPVLSRALGITYFDLLGDFGRMDWLGNFYIILSYNLLFAVATALCLMNKFTATVRNEIYLRLKMVLFRRDKLISMSSSFSGPSGIKDN